MLAVSVLWEGPLPQSNGSDSRAVPMDTNDTDESLRCAFLKFLDTLRAGMEVRAAPAMSDCRILD
jgi:hypothetical protein